MKRPRRLPPSRPLKLVPTDEQLAKQQLDLELDKRATRCMSRIQAVLAEERCSVVATAVFNFDGATMTPALAWNVKAL